MTVNESTVLLATGCTAAVCGCGVFMFALYDIILSFDRRVVWEDGATRRQKARVHVQHLFLETDWRAAPKMFSIGATIGAAVAFIVILLGVGFSEVFL